MVLESRARGLDDRQTQPEVMGSVVVAILAPQTLATTGQILRFEGISRIGDAHPRSIPVGAGANDHPRVLWRVAARVVDEIAQGDFPQRSVRVELDLVRQLADDDHA